METRVPALHVIGCRTTAANILSDKHGKQVGVVMMKVVMKAVQCRLDDGRVAHFLGTTELCSW